MALIGCLLILFAIVGAVAIIELPRSLTCALVTLALPALISV